MILELLTLQEWPDRLFTSAGCIFSLGTEVHLTHSNAEWRQIHKDCSTQTGQLGTWIYMTLVNFLTSFWSQWREKCSLPVLLSCFRYLQWDEMNFQLLIYPDRWTTGLGLPALLIAMVFFFFSWCPSVKQTTELQQIWGRMGHLNLVWVLFACLFVFLCLILFGHIKSWSVLNESIGLGNIQVSQQTNKDINMGNNHSDWVNVELYI